ncbi:hypothetical protein EDC01DRAFT_27451 [Geopyxis carbonaria]|nr:hypothetical protein EDC01DRAFT_27451 [Geopyxis carbonaria]
MTASFNSASSRHLSHGNYESPVVQLSPSHHRRRDSNTGKGMGRGDESPSVLQQNTRTPRPSRNRIEDAFGPFLSPPHSSPPRRVSARTSQLEDPQNAGALDSFITRTPQSMTRGAKPRTRPSIGQEKAGIFPLPFSTELPIDLEPPPYSSQSPLFSPKIRRDFVSATTVLHNNLENEDLIMEDVDALAPQNQMATHRKRRASIVEADEGDDLYSRPAPPPRKNKQNPNQNRQNRATTALIIEPLPQESVPKRRRTRDLSLLEIVPLPQDQVVNLVQTIDFQSIQGQSLQDVFDIHKGDSLYNLSASEPTGFSLDVKGLRELMELIISWERRLGIDEDALGAWTVEETDEGWKRISPKQSSESL